MPGLSIICQDNLSREKLKSAADELIYKNGYYVRELASQKNTVSFFSGYDGYPFRQYDTGDFSISIEGLIYNQTDAETESLLMNTAQDYCADRDYETEIKKFIEAADGEYLIHIYFKKKNESLIFNDRWGKLPVFYASEDGIFALSREIKFILHFLPQIAFNRLTMAEFLVFEYNFGDKTLIDGIHRLAPATMVKINHSSTVAEAEFKVLKPVDLTGLNTRLTRKEMIDECLRLFRKSLEDRINKLHERNLLITADLSGGFDTRAVFAGLCNLDVDFIACNDNIITGNEMDIAGKVAEIFGKNLLCFEAPHPVDDIPELSRLTYITDCLVNCHTTTACWYDDIERDRIIKGRHANFMGFGGEPIRHPLKPKSGYAELHEMLIDDAFSNFLRIPDACRLLGISKDEFSLNIKNEIDKYPEQSIDDKLKHLFFDLHDKQVKGGENRHRIFRWTVNPLWGNDLFDFEISNIPLKIIDDDFFADFAAGIDLRTLKVPVHGKSYRLDNRAGRIRSVIERKITSLFRDNRRLFKIADTYLQRCQETRDFQLSGVKLWEFLVEKIKNDRNQAAYFSLDAVNQFAENCRHEKRLYQVLTPVLYIDEIERKFPGRIK